MSFSWLKVRTGNMSSLYQRGKVWVYQYWRDGKLVQISLRTKNAQIAKEKRKKLDAQLTLGQLGIVSGKIAVADALDHLVEIRRSGLKESTLYRYRGIVANLKKIMAGFRRTYVQELTDTDVARFVTLRKRQGASDKTIFEELLVLKGAIKLLISQRHLTMSPVVNWPRVRKTTRKPDTIGGYTPDEIRRIKEALTGHPTFDYFMGLIYLGCRRSELWAITRADIDFENNTVRINNLKTATNPQNQFRHVEIHPDLLSVLARRCDGKRADEPILPMKGKGLWLIKVLSKVCKRLQIRWRRLHGIRHAFISSLLNAGVPLRVVMAMAGHGDFHTTMRYSHVTQDDMRGKISALGYAQTEPLEGADATEPIRVVRRPPARGRAEGPRPEKADPKPIPLVIDEEQGRGPSATAESTPRKKKRVTQGPRQ